jgi:hypothetical protein
MAILPGNFHATRRPHHHPLAWVLAWLWMTVASSTAFAEPGNVGWKTDSQLYLTGMSNFRQTQSGLASFNTVAATAEIKISNLARPYYGGLFADYRTSGSESVGNSINIGGYFRYDLSEWDATTWLFASKSDGVAESWIYAGRLRYRVAENHKVGIEVTSSLSRFDSPALAVGYYGSLSDSLSLNIIADHGLGKRSDIAARMKLVWRIH